jgi:hypothetical protein
MKKLIQNIVVITLCSSLVTGCAVSRKSFIEKRGELSDVDVCRVVLKDSDKLQFNYIIEDEEERVYVDALSDQFKRRKLSVSLCEQKVSDDNAQKMMIGLVILGAAATAAAASYGGGGGSPQNYNNTGYAWDAFYDQYYNLTWRCRDKSNGQFAYDYNCSTKVKVDTTWPSK